MKNPKPPTPHTLTPQRKRSPAKLSLTIDPEVIRHLDLRGEERSPVVSRDLERYYRLLAETRPTLRERFSPAEISLVIDACNGWATWMEPFDLLRLIWANVEDSIRLDGLDQKWEIPDPPGLVQRLKSLSPVEVLALCDAVERFWHAVGQGDHSRDLTTALD